MNALFSEGLTDVIIYSSPDDPKKKNRGFAFLEYDTHKSASIAKRRIGNGRTKVWGCDIIVDWADPQEEPDIDTMSKVRTQSKYSLPSLQCRVRRPENHCYLRCMLHSMFCRFCRRENWLSAGIKMQRSRPYWLCVST